jgi:hypothetical protein
MQTRDCSPLPPSLNALQDNLSMIRGFCEEERWGMLQHGLKLLVAMSGGPAGDAAFCERNYR